MKYLLSCLLILTAVSAVAQTGTITVIPDTQYSQRDTFVTVQVLADADFVEIKALRLDIDIDPTVVEPDTLFVELGPLFPASTDSTFFFYLLSPDRSRLTIDIAVLGDGRTKSGPGQLATIRLNTKAFGISDILIADYKVRDTLNQPILVNIQHSWVRVCRFVGDITADDRVDLSDLSALISYLVMQVPVPSPMAVANVNCEGDVDLSDLSLMIAYLIQGTPLCNLCL
jgi:hypothetical protein